MTDGLLSGCLGFCRLEASRLTGAVKRCSTYYRLLLKSPHISEVLLHCHRAEPMQKAAVCNVPGHLHGSCIGFIIMDHVLWQISYHSTIKQGQLLDFHTVSAWISFLCAVFPGLCVGRVYTKLDLSPDITILQKCQYLKNRDMLYQSYR